MSIKNFFRNNYYRFLYSRRVKSYREKNIKTLAIVYFIPKTNQAKYHNWEDGFTKAINLLEKKYTVTWVNLADKKIDVTYLNTFDFIIVKSCWDWIVDKYIQSLKGLKVPRGIAISCSKMPLNRNALFFYDVLWYETYWYGNKLKKHPRSFQAFGINTKKFYNQNLDKKYDVLSIGLLAKYKRHHYILAMQGSSKIVIGDTNTEESKIIKEELKDNEVTILEYKNQKELARLINQSKLVYIPAEINGGGERAVLEARMCGAKVKVESDNPKLVELLTSKIWTENDYYSGLLKGINSLKK